MLLHLLSAAALLLPPPRRSLRPTLPRWHVSSSSTFMRRSSLADGASWQVCWYAFLTSPDATSCSDYALDTAEGGQLPYIERPEDWRTRPDHPKPDGAPWLVLRTLLYPIAHPPSPELAHRAQQSAAPGHGKPSYRAGHEQRAHPCHGFRAGTNIAVPLQSGACISRELTLRRMKQMGAAQVKLNHVFVLMKDGDQAGRYWISNMIQRWSQ